MREKPFQTTSEHNGVFWLHLFITALAWAGPFLFSWELMCLAYGIVILQFAFFKKCLMNDGHGLKGSEDASFYSYLFSMVGIATNERMVKNFARRYLYILLGIFSFVWQYVWGFEPLLF